MGIDSADLTITMVMQGTQRQYRLAKDMGQPQPPGKYPKLTVDYNDTGIFVFTIMGQNDLTFARTQPFAPKAGPNPGDFASQFHVVSGAGRKTMVVTSANANPDGSEYAGGTYNYELRFSDGSKLDPVITNGGCCRPTPQPQQPNLVYYAIGAIALAALFLLFLRPYLAKRAAAADSTRKKG